MAKKPAKNSKASPKASSKKTATKETSTKTTSKTSTETAKKTADKVKKTATKKTTVAKVITSNTPAQVVKKEEGIGKFLKIEIDGIIKKLGDRPGSKNVAAVLSLAHSALPNHFSAFKRFAELISGEARTNTDPTIENLFRSLVTVTNRASVNTSGRGITVSEKAQVKQLQGHLALIKTTFKIGP